MHCLVNGENNMIQKNLTISAIVIAKNEEKRIAACLNALSFCDEVVVVDNGSADGTGLVAAKLGANVVQSRSHDFAQLHNLGAKEAKGDWLLYVDADEVVDETLRMSIKNTTGNFSAYYVQRKNYYLGKPWPGSEQILRCMRKDSLDTWKGALHETAVVKGEVGLLNGFLRHDTHRTLEEMVAKTNEWSAVEAKLRLDAWHPVIVPWRLFRVFLTGFFHTYFHDGGWRAGSVGMIESLYQAFSLFITYAKLWELQEKKK